MKRGSLVLFGCGCWAWAGAALAGPWLTSEQCFAKKRHAVAQLEVCRAYHEVLKNYGSEGDAQYCVTNFEYTMQQIDLQAQSARVPCRFRDNGDKTITDYDTGLQWENRTSSSGIHITPPYTSCRRDCCSDSSPFPSYTELLLSLNELQYVSGAWSSNCFAGHCDWRLPSREELLTIRLDPCARIPCLEPIFGRTGLRGIELLMMAYNDIFASTFGIVEIGIPGAAGRSARFSNSDAVAYYLPATGEPAPLGLPEFINPSSTASGALGGEVLALTLNVAYSDAGWMSVAGPPFGDLRLNGYALTPLFRLEGMSVREFLSVMNTHLGGGEGIYSIGQLYRVLVDLNWSFHLGKRSDFARVHLVCGPGCTLGDFERITFPQEGWGDDDLAETSGVAGYMSIDYQGLQTGVDFFPYPDGTIGNGRGAVRAVRRAW